ncbi:hypothetical protein [Streptomyces sp. NBC_00091]|uniref:hypothetical protein n=1 Tax=Streptomyces sp. NBC_00091 TaxID=2975648 RepID=UPI00224E9DA9|nr:hypothetical protein [Streptomyces sp. NBC_00091]MCX5380519.1 hypothetical protein [Streptomyces sp. NBC_00091]
MMPRRPRAVAAVVTLAVCVAATTACESEGRPGVRRAEPLSEAELMSVLPAEKAFPGYTVRPRAADAPPSPARTGSELAPGSPEECRALVDFEIDHGLRHRPTARVLADVSRRGDTSGRREKADFAKFHSVALSSYTVEEASAVMDSLKKAVPLCGTFLVYTLSYGDQDARIRVGERPAPAAGDDAVSFDWTVPDIPMNETVPVTLVRTGGVIASYSGAVPAGIPQRQHGRLRAFLSGSGG